MITTQLDVAEAYHVAATKSVARQYRTLGYEVREEEELVPGIRPDLVVRRGDETILIEVKVRSLALPQEQVLAKMQAYAQQLTPPAQVRLVVVTPPAEKAIEFDDIEASLLDWLQAHYAETELGPDIYPTRIIAAEIQRVVVQQGQLTATGACDVVVQYAVTADFDPTDEPGVLSLRFTVRFDPEVNQFAFANIVIDN